VSWEFIQAKVDQAKIINELVNSAYRGEGSKRGWTTEADILGGQRTDSNGIRELIHQEHSVILLGMLTVNPTLQGKGLGAMMLEEAEAFAQFWDCHSIFMTVIAQRPELIQWYEKHGYQRNGESKPFPYGDEKFGLPKVEGLHFIVLQKSI
jgi:GNAT superfamily N-acetyltransferase